MPDEPTLRDVLHQLQVIELELRAGFAESRARDAELFSRVQTFWDAFSEFRRDYLEHSNGNEAA